MPKQVKVMTGRVGFVLRTLKTDKHGTKIWDDHGVFLTKDEAKAYAQKWAKGDRVHIEGARVDFTPLAGYSPKKGE